MDYLITAHIHPGVSKQGPYGRRNSVQPPTMLCCGVSRLTSCEGWTHTHRLGTDQVSQGQHLSLELGAGGILVLEGRGAVSLGEPRASQDETKKMDRCVSGHSEGAAGLRGGNSPPYKKSNMARLQGIRTQR